MVSNVIISDECLTTALLFYIIYILYLSKRGAFMSYHINEGLWAAIAPNVDVTVSTILYVVFFVAACAVGYLLGSINSAILVSKALYGDDIRKHGSGNAGLTNMLRTFGLGAAGLTLLGDFLKTALSIFIAGVLFGFYYVAGVSTGAGMCYIAGMFAVIGHIAPAYYHFKGGKGVLSTAVMVAILAPIPFLFLITLFIIIVAISKYVSLGSVVSAILLPVILSGYFTVVFEQGSTPGLAALSTIVIAILIVYCHRGNLQRINNRTERKISFKKKEKTPAEENDDASES